MTPAFRRTINIRQVAAAMSRPRLEWWIQSTRETLHHPPAPSRYPTVMPDVVFCARCLGVLRVELAKREADPEIEMQP